MQNSVGKTFRSIKSLPESPSRRIYWIVYNQDMVPYTENLIKEIRGEEYFRKYVTVVAKNDPSKERAKGIVYFDPLLYYHLGNGNA